MSRIDNPEQARRLARSIASDIAAYNEKKLHTIGPGVDPLAVLTEEVREGRVLFQNRVEPALFPLYDEVIGEALRGALKFQVATPVRPASSLIEDPEKARRLARAISGDIALYNEEKLNALGPDGDPFSVLSQEIEEGRALFLSRVSPDLVALYEEAIKEALRR